MKLILLWILVIASKIAVAQPGTKVKELLRDRYTVSNGNYGHPYTLFDKNNGRSFECEMLEACIHPQWVKANAFINMVGLDITTNSGGFMVVSEMTSTEYFKNNAIGGLEGCTNPRNLPQSPQSA